VPVLDKEACRALESSKGARVRSALNLKVSNPLKVDLIKLELIYGSLDGQT